MCTVIQQAYIYIYIIWPDPLRAVTDSAWGIVQKKTLSFISNLAKLAVCDLSCLAGSPEPCLQEWIMAATVVIYSKCRPLLIVLADLS